MHLHAKPALEQANSDLVITASEICGWLETQVAAISHLLQPQLGPKASQLEYFPERFFSKTAFQASTTLLKPSDITCHLIRKIEEVRTLSVSTTYYLQNFPLFFQLEMNKKSSSHLRIITEPSAEPTWLGAQYHQLSVPSFKNFSFYFLSHSVQWPVTSISLFHY